ncbi:MAG: hypothetical protein JHD16_05010 [Solirubrobacteraceae bacterium]|nr:hypothetical protein [Solirubrobacteraceae bacterium]
MSWRVVPTCAAVLASSLLLPAAGWSAVPRTGNTFSPRDGAELVEAASAISTEGRTNAGFRAVIQLAAREYAVSQTVVLTSLAAPTVAGPAEGRAVVTNSGAPIPLLRVSSAQTPTAGGISGVDFVLKASGQTSTTLSVVDLQRGSLLRDASVTVPASTSTSKATAVRLSPSAVPPSPAPAPAPTPAVMQDVRVQSAATEAPGVRASNGSQVLDSTITGGTSPLEVVGDASGTTLGNVTVDSTTVTSPGTSAAVPVVKVRGGGNALRAVLWSSVVDGSSGAGQLVDVTGPSAASGSLTVDLGQTTLSGAASSIGLRVRPGAGTSPLTVRARGLLSLGSQVAAVNCAGSVSAQTNVTVSGVYRVGGNTAETGCDLVETERRIGALEWRDEAAGDLRPVWDSPLVDAVSDAAVPAPAGERDLMGGARFVQVGQGLPGDIGALEYQLTPPEDVSANFLTLGNRGLTALVGEGFDPDPLEEARLRFQWTLADGTKIDGPVVLHRFASDAAQQVKLAVSDVTGVTVLRTITVEPAIRLGEAPTDSNDGEPPLPVPPVVEPPGPAPVVVPPFLPQAVVIPQQPAAAPVVLQTAQPPIDPSLKQDFPPIIKKVTAGSRRVLTSRRTNPKYASARRGEAEFLIETWRESEMALEVSNVVEGQGLTVGLPVATVPLRPFKGRKTLRVGAKIGNRKLRPGLYQMTIAATPRPGAVPERVPFYVRVLRAR